MFPKNLKALIADQGLTQAAFATKCGLPLDRIRNACKGNVRELRSDELKAIRDATGVRELWLTTDRGPMYLTEQERATLPMMDALDRASKSVANIDAPDWVKRSAQEWLFAVYRGDGPRLIELATQNISPKSDSGGMTTISLSESLLQQVIEQSLTEIERQGSQMRPDKLAALLFEVYRASAKPGVVDSEWLSRLVKLAS